MTTHLRDRAIPAERGSGVKTLILTVSMGHLGSAVAEAGRSRDPDRRDSSFVRLHARPARARAGDVERRSGTGSQSGRET